MNQIRDIRGYAHALCTINVHDGIMFLAKGPSIMSHRSKIIFQIRVPCLPKTVSTLCHVCLFNHFEADGAGRVDTVKILLTVTVLTSNVRKLTKQNRCFCLRRNSTSHCKGEFDGGLSFCCLKIRRVCSEMRKRLGQSAQRPKLAPTSRWQLPRSERAQQFQNCYRYWWRRWIHRRLNCWCRCLCRAQNSPHQHFAVVGCPTSL